MIFIYENNILIDECKKYSNVMYLNMYQCLTKAMF